MLRLWVRLELMSEDPSASAFIESELLTYVTERYIIKRLVSDVLATADRLRYADQLTVREVARVFTTAPPEVLTRHFREVRSLFRWLPEDVQNRLRSTNTFWRRMPLE